MARHKPNIRITSDRRPESEIDTDLMVNIVMDMGRQLKAEYDEEVGRDNPEAMDLWLDEKRESWSLPPLPADTTLPKQPLDAAEADVEALGKSGLRGAAREQTDQ